VLVVDAANVVGSRPTGWWRDRAGAAATLVAAIRAARVEGRIDAPVVVVLEGRARDGVPEGDADGIEVVHARGSGDDAIVEVVAAAPDSAITVVSADRGLTERVRALGAAVLGPSWLNERVF
jgi:rRNA-processing protein FCF1